MPSMLIPQTNHKEIVGDDKLREQKCLAAINMDLDRFDCLLVPQIVLTPGNVNAMVKIVAKPRTVNG